MMMRADISSLNKEMVAAGVRVFVGGLSSAPSAKSLRAEADGKVVITNGPYLETKLARRRFLGAGNRESG
jgi:hypothetical protein